MWLCEGISRSCENNQSQEEVLCKACVAVGCEVARSLSPEGLQQDLEVCLTPGELCLSAHPPAVWKDKMSHWQGSGTFNFPVKPTLCPNHNVISAFTHVLTLKLKMQHQTISFVYFCFLQNTEHVQLLPLIAAITDLFVSFRFFKLRLPVYLWWCKQGPSTYQCWLRLRLFPSSPWWEVFSGDSNSKIWTMALFFPTREMKCS